MHELAERIRRLTGSQSPLVFRELPEDDPRQRRPDISKAKMLLQWQPQVSLDDGLAQTIASIRERLAANADSP